MPEEGDHPTKVTVGSTGNLTFKWDLKNLEIKTRSVEKTLEPLVMQVTTLVNSKGSSKKKKGRSKRAHVLVAAVEAATKNFIDRGDEIANENPEIRNEMLTAVEEVRKTGNMMSDTARKFAAEPCVSEKRAAMVSSARALLLAVTRLLILADMVDVHLLTKSLKVVENDLEMMKNASSNAELLKNHQQFEQSVSELVKRAAIRQSDLMDPFLQDDLAAARATLKRTSAMLLTASKAYIRHPELAAARDNRDFVLKQVCEAVNTINDVAQGKATGKTQMAYESPGELAAALDDFDELIRMNPLEYNQVTTRPDLEDRLESIISGAALMADSFCTREVRRVKIVEECNAVRDALQGLLTEFEMNLSRPEPLESLEGAVETLHQKTHTLRHQLSKAVGDHVSDGLLDTEAPLRLLIESARAGNESDVEEYAKVFADHSRMLVEVANVTTTMSNNEDGVKMVRSAVDQIILLCPQVINAASILAARPKSKVAQDNMDSFKEAWENQVQLLTEAVDEITTIDDFLAVTESHILEDVKKCVEAINNGDQETLKSSTDNIKGRASRVCNVVSAEMDDFESCLYTDNVLAAVRVMKEEALPNFGNKVDIVLNALESDPQKDVDENEFIDASHLVYDGVREIRTAVLMNKTDEELDQVSLAGDDMMTYTAMMVETTVPDEETLVDEYPDVSGISTARDAMRNLSEEDKGKIAEQVETFHLEKVKFDKEVARWDDTGNDIVVLANLMCRVMMEMTDFARGRGSLKTTMDVISAAKKLSELGKKLDRLTREIAEECPESRNKDDMLAYLDRIALYCQQLNITSRVKADVQNISGELIVSGLDSATSLIQAAKNLMNAVVLTVKASYVASTKYQRHANKNATLVIWKMKAPEKQPLVRREKVDEARARVRKGSQKKQVSAIKILAEFDTNEEFV